MKVIIVLGLLFIFGVCDAQAQSKSTRIERIEIDGKVVKKNIKSIFFQVTSGLKRRELLQALLFQAS
jgi:hypothetical protein